MCVWIPQCSIVSDVRCVWCFNRIILVRYFFHCLTNVSLASSHCVCQFWVSVLVVVSVKTARKIWTNQHRHMNCVGIEQMNNESAELVKIIRLDNEHYRVDFVGIDVLRRRRRVVVVVSGGDSTYNEFANILVVAQHFDCSHTYWKPNNWKNSGYANLVAVKKDEWCARLSPTTRMSMT